MAAGYAQSSPPANSGVLRACDNALVSACVSRLRPVLLAAGATIVGKAQLLCDDFLREMAVSILGGLAFGSLLALLAVPVFLRARLFDRKEPQRGPKSCLDVLRHHVAYRCKFTVA